ncbi:MAG: flagellar assembly protein FliW [Candidatus Synoicihabitans palmerolidicus]|nr:flagellar assembly protein FliW [Candidatus Synoicihabitans palmerolidicus]
MKVSSELISPVAPPDEIQLPQGLVGFTDYTHFSVIYQEDQLPFCWMRLHGPEDELHFVVIEPGNVLPDYEPEIYDEDAAYLELKDPADAMMINIVTGSHGSQASATVNLTGPVVINRRTGRAKQVVLANHAVYSARHPLVTG